MAQTHEEKLYAKILLKNMENDNANLEMVAIELELLHYETLETSTFFCVH